VRKKNKTMALAGLALIVMAAVSPVVVADVAGWSNGGYSANPASPDYGTHDWIAEHALDWLPQQEKQFLLDNKATYLYGTELPDNSQAADGIGDTTKHHVYYRADGSLQDDAAAVRAREEYAEAVDSYKAGNRQDAAKHLGAVTHYIADMAVFGHVMGSSTAWGAEQHHSDYEEYVTRARTVTRTL
jgi:Zinc dependent phospholipase C